MTYPLGCTILRFDKIPENYWCFQQPQQNLLLLLNVKLLKGKYERILVENAHK